MKGLLTGIASGAVVAGAVTVGTLTLVPAVEVGPQDESVVATEGVDAVEPTTAEQSVNDTVVSAETAPVGSSDEAQPDPAPVNGSQPETTDRIEAPSEDHVQTGEVAATEDIEAAEEPARPSDFDLPLLVSPAQAPALPLGGSLPNDAAVSNDVPRRPAGPAREGEPTAPALSEVPSRAEAPEVMLRPTQPEALDEPEPMIDASVGATGVVPDSAGGPVLDTSAPQIAGVGQAVSLASAPSGPERTQAQVQIAEVQPSGMSGAPRPPTAENASPTIMAVPEAPTGPVTETPPAPLEDAPDQPSAADRQLVIVREEPGLASDAAPVRSLPQVGADPVPAEPQEATSQSEPSDALTRNAVPVDVASELPRLAIVLLDDETAPILTEPRLSVAIFADAPDAAARAQAWRDAGQEIVVIPALTGGTPQDVAQALEGSLRAVPTAATVMPADLGGFPGGTATDQSVIARLASSGHGLITRPSGLDGTGRIAAQEGVPSQPVLRRVDGEGRDARAIARFLDGAAFDASRRGSAIVLAGNTAQTRAALDTWLDGTRARGAAFVPVSALLLAE
ncbi:Divergent polysaccharide deacetylase [Rhodobacteraceae bacterium THAF1]|uniref:divergent polysaccharide deacetylase family protein n=1 Tax=Palleronia sp. THAF1 TaxID=2587842 RepID=UPI000F3AE206|nr:divergent polysaccharide deacetylase family protein [Palleronia sp. THAF1]QFU09024.1 Divergent polysaccharide deacetylase [Palleronia sp. THAF1]VDC24221.1 Divergent polysaccharide deacetylase [Rhodobacteraceae bacterium THAF1]